MKTKYGSEEARIKAIERDLTTGNITWASLVVRALRVLGKGIVKGKTKGGTGKLITGAVTTGLSVKEILDVMKWAAAGKSKKTLKQTLLVTATGRPQSKVVTENVDDIINIIWEATKDTREKYGVEDWEAKYKELLKLYSTSHPGEPYT